MRPSTGPEACQSHRHGRAKHALRFVVAHLEILDAVIENCRRDTCKSKFRHARRFPLQLRFDQLCVVEVEVGIARARLDVG